MKKTLNRYLTLVLSLSILSSSSISFAGASGAKKVNDSKSEGCLSRWFGCWKRTDPKKTDAKKVNSNETESLLSSILVGFTSSNDNKTATISDNSDTSVLSVFTSSLASMNTLKPAQATQPALPLHPLTPFPMALSTMKNKNACQTGFDFVKAMDAFWGMEDLFSDTGRYDTRLGLDAVNGGFPEIEIITQRRASEAQYRTGGVRSWEGKGPAFYATYMVARFLLELERHYKQYPGYTSEILDRFHNLVNPLVPTGFGEKLETYYSKLADQKQLEFFQEDTIFRKSSDATIIKKATAIRPFMENLSGKEQAASVLFNQGKKAILQKIPYFGAIHQIDTTLLNAYILGSELKAFCTGLDETSRNTIQQILIDWRRGHPSPACN